MNRSCLFVLVSLSLSALAAGCGGDDSSSHKSSTLRLDGTYKPTEQGAIASVTFSNDRDYELVPSGCNASDCVDRGTYRLDSASNTVTLENAVTHRERTITLENVRTEGSAASLVAKTIGTRTGELVSRGNETAQSGQDLTGDQQQLNGGQQKLNDGQQQLVDQVQQLIETIKEAAMNGQGMKQDDQGGQQQNGQQQNGQQQNGQQQQQQDDQQQQQQQPAGQQPADQDDNDQQ
jgi:hypothetical protein